MAFNVLSIVQGHPRKKNKKKKNILIFNVLSIILRHLSKKKEFLRLTACHLYIVTQEQKKEVLDVNILSFIEGL